MQNLLTKATACFVALALGFMPITPYPMAYGNDPYSLWNYTQTTETSDFEKEEELKESSDPAGWDWDSSTLQEPSAQSFKIRAMTSPHNEYIAVSVDEEEIAIVTWERPWYSESYKGKFDSAASTVRVDISANRFWTVSVKEEEGRYSLAKFETEESYPDYDYSARQTFDFTPDGMPETVFYGSESASYSYLSRIHYTYDQEKHWSDSHIGISSYSYPVYYDDEGIFDPNEKPEKYYSIWASVAGMQEGYHTKTSASVYGQEEDALAALYERIMTGLKEGVPDAKILADLENHPSVPMKTVAYYEKLPTKWDNQSFEIDFVKNAEGRFIPRVERQPHDYQHIKIIVDAGPDTARKDFKTVLFKNWQPVTAPDGVVYTASFGRSYDYGSDAAGNFRKEPEGFRYGLSLMAWTVDDSGMWRPQGAFLEDFPKEREIMLNGKKFFLNLDDEGILTLESRMEPGASVTVKGLLKKVPDDQPSTLMRSVYTLTQEDGTVVLVDGADDVGRLLLPGHEGTYVELMGRYFPLEGVEILTVTHINGRPVSELIEDARIAAEEEMERLRAELLLKTDGEIRVSERRISEYEEQIRGLWERLEKIVRELQAQIKEDREVLGGQAAILHEIMTSKALSEETKAEIKAFLEKLKHYLGDNEDGTSGRLEEMVREYIDAIKTYTEIETGYLKGAVLATQEYIEALQAYKAKVAAAETVEELKRLAGEFPVMPMLVRPAIAYYLPPDPRETTKDLIRAADELITKAREERPIYTSLHDALTGHHGTGVEIQILENRPGMCTMGIPTTCWGEVTYFLAPPRFITFDEEMPDIRAGLYKAGYSYTYNLEDNGVRYTVSDSRQVDSVTLNGALREITGPGFLQRTAFVFDIGVLDAEGDKSVSQTTSLVIDGIEPEGVADVLREYADSSKRVNLTVAYGMALEGTYLFVAQAVNGRPVKELIEERKETEAFRRDLLERVDEAEAGAKQMIVELEAKLEAAEEEFERVVRALEDEMGGKAQDLEVLAGKLAELGRDDRISDETREAIDDFIVKVKIYLAPDFEVTDDGSLLSNLRYEINAYVAYLKMTMVDEVRYSLMDWKMYADALSQYREEVMAARTLKALKELSERFPTLVFVRPAVMIVDPGYPGKRFEEYFALGEELRSRALREIGDVEAERERLLKEIARLTAQYGDRPERLREESARKQALVEGWESRLEGLVSEEKDLYEELMSLDGSVEGIEELQAEGAGVHAWLYGEGNMNSVPQAWLVIEHYRSEAALDWEEAGLFDEFLSELKRIKEALESGADPRGVELPEVPGIMRLMGMPAGDPDQTISELGKAIETLRELIALGKALIEEHGKTEAFRRDLLERVDKAQVQAKEMIRALEEKLAAAEKEFKRVVAALEEEMAQGAARLRHLAGELERLASDERVSDRTREAIEYFVAKVEVYLSGTDNVNADGSFAPNLRREIEAYIAYLKETIVDEIRYSLEDWKRYLGALGHYREEVMAAQTWEELKALSERFPEFVDSRRLPLIQPPYPGQLLKAYSEEGEALKARAQEEIERAEKRESQLKEIRTALEGAGAVMKSVSHLTEEILRKEDTNGDGRLDATDIENLTGYQSMLTQARSGVAAYVEKLLQIQSEEEEVKQALQDAFSVLQAYLMDLDARIAIVDATIKSVRGKLRNAKRKKA